MDDRKRLENLGKLVNNMQFLEMLLRACLFEDEITKGISEQVENVIYIKGEALPENAYTNWDNLGKLIRKYNGLPVSKGHNIDETLVDIRDAIAHGRVILFEPSGVIQLVKFDEPDKNGVKVEFSVAMTEEWVGRQGNRFYEAIRKVDEVHQKQRAERLG